MFFEAKLVSVSQDTTIKIWDLYQPVSAGFKQGEEYEDTAVVIFDHQAPIVSADVLRLDGRAKLASIDESGAL